MSGNDTQIADEVIRYIFKQYKKCLEQDRSKVRINGFMKGVLQASVRDSTIDSTAVYVSNMYDADLNELLNGIENILKKRQKL